MTTPIVLSRSLLDRILREAEKHGVTPDEYLAELLVSSQDPDERAREYIEAAYLLLQEAREEAEKGNVRQAAEKIWGAAALAIKAYAWHRERKRLSSHGELWEYARRLKREFGSWVYNAWMSANGTYICFYEGWCNAEDVKEALVQVEKLVERVRALIEGKG
ncbi:PaREP1 family protein [Pyrolobus fumarii 1A]|uniref:PaREP1 family protein n=1 Tax=Pyrolobus fumarii (strain DSM 11204 / 1A) TaxID=694429 RepID=G0EDF4_PYRF1|nr:PaREP1 family protein [Pyrolobus fumarii]AEM38639.1 PaREP1 family protein [Pyrolobus fumarii 1A]